MKKEETQKQKQTTLKKDYTINQYLLIIASHFILSCTKCTLFPIFQLLTQRVIVFNYACLHIHFKCDIVSFLPNK